MTFTAAGSRIRCFDHVLNLAVQSGLKDDVVKGAVEKVLTIFLCRIAVLYHILFLKMLILVL